MNADKLEATHSQAQDDDAAAAAAAGAGSSQASDYSIRTTLVSVSSPQIHGHKLLYPQLRVILYTSLQPYPYLLIYPSPPQPQLFTQSRRAWAQ